MTCNKNCTRYYSSRQEKSVAKTVKGKTVANSGAPRFVAGDVTSDIILIECKTVTKEQKSFTIKKEWIDKNKEEAFAMRKPYSAIAFSFGDDINHFIIDEKLFKILLEKLRDEENAG